MLKAEWGVKRTCSGCGARFYDLKRDPIICPKCDTEFVVAALPKPKRAKPANPAKDSAKDADKKTDDLIDDEDLGDDDDADDTDIDGDDAALGSDDDGGDDTDDDVIVAKGGDSDVLLDDDDDDDDLDEVKTVKTGDDALKDS